MKSKTILSVIAGSALSILLVLPLHAKNNKEAMSPEMQAMMTKVKAAGTPSTGHEHLKAFEGNWKVSSKFWMKPGDKAQKSTATSSFTWVLGGRFLQQKYHGHWAGQPFEGLGFVGFDNVKQDYVSIWMDSMSTGISESAGQYDAASKTIEDKGSMSCPMSPSKIKNYRTEWKVINKNTTRYTMYTNAPSGKEFKSMELNYTRAK